MNKLIAMYLALQSMMQTKLKDERGATMVEYALMVALVAIVAMVGAEPLGVAIDAIFDEITAKL